MNQCVRAVLWGKMRANVWNSGTKSATLTPVNGRRKSCNLYAHQCGRVPSGQSGTLFFPQSFHLAEMYVTTAMLQGIYSVAKIYTAHSALWRGMQLIDKRCCDKHNAVSSLKPRRCDKHNAVSSFLDYSCGSFILLSAPLETAAVPVSCRHHNFRHVLNC
jgi:hypothetical protein